ncbi:hypothetical protein AArc1_1849 [Natrarchaeobaculum sulfurireducens]|uniref:Uncharacterized protein n=1 Tax=Natrarchaeobaculum sulfurireducens TaxID=2044521 RepID=A0A346PF77_9EURY|nr:hypothetical protein AArc1_1849 [Natrarchaeobaculum sulfurireducens]
MTIEQATIYVVHDADVPTEEPVEEPAEEEPIDDGPSTMTTTSRTRQTTPSYRWYRADRLHRHLRFRDISSTRSG